jgi:hypothetical protein
MVYALLVLIAGGLACAALELLPAGARRESLARALALASLAGALGSTLVLEGFGAGSGGEVVGIEIAGWLGAPIFAADPLSTGLGAWALGIGLPALLKIGHGHGEQNAPLRLAAGVGLVATLYSLAFTIDLRAFAGQVLLLALLIWALSGGIKPEWYARQRVSLAVGTVLLLGAVLLVGRTTGGEYRLDELSLSALTLWPLALIVGWALLWLGLTPFTGWSALTGEHDGALVHAVALGVPPITLLLRLQGLITEGALTGSTPAEWAGAMSTLAILGALTAIAAGAGTLMWAGTPRWRSALTAHWMGLVAWALGLDSPNGRWAALALFAAYGVGALALQLANRAPGQPQPSGGSWVTRAVAGLSLAGAPLSAGFVGLWLLATALLETRGPALAVVVLGAAILSACGTALHIAWRADAGQESAPPPSPSNRYRFLLDLAGWALAGILIAGGILPGVWLPYVESVADVAGAGQALDLPWPGIVRGELMIPLTMLGAGMILLAFTGWLLRASATSRVAEAGALLPTALDRLQRGPARRTQTGSGDGEALRPAPPAFVWWLSLAWLEGGVFEAGTLLARLGAGAGRLTARLEGRYFLPLAALLALLTLLAITR